MAVAEVKLYGVATDHAPVLDDDAGEGLLIGAADFVAEQIALAGVFGAGRCGAEFFHRDVLLRAVVPNEGDFGADEFEAMNHMRSIGHLPTLLFGKKRKRSNSQDSSKNIKPNHLTTRIVLAFNQLFRTLYLCQ